MVPIEFEITAELPARYVRRDEIPARESGPTTIGFNGSDLIQIPAAAPPPDHDVRGAGGFSRPRDRGVVGRVADGVLAGVPV